MFTGIIEEMGRVRALSRLEDNFTLTIAAGTTLKGLSIGDSISVNGVCLTVTSFTIDEFSVDIMPETVKATNLQRLAAGDSVNLERSMPADGRFGGHFVSGHIDGIGEIMTRQGEDNAVSFQIRTSNRVTRYLVTKGSVAVDGTSLTVFGVSRDLLTISLIPHTLDATVLGFKEAGDVVNIEVDIMGKYIEKLLVERGSPERNHQDTDESYFDRKRMR